MTDKIDFEAVEELKRAFHEAFAPGNRRFRIASDVMNERKRQNEKFGTLHYPDGTGRPGDEETAKRLKAACKANTQAEDNWRDILAEEVAEAFAETDREKLRTELVQVSAVAQAWIEDIDKDEDTDDTRREDEPGDWIIADFDGECSRGGHVFGKNVTVRADSDGGWECRACVEDPAYDKELFDLKLLATFTDGVCADIDRRLEEKGIEL